MGTTPQGPASCWPVLGAPAVPIAAALLEAGAAQVTVFDINKAQETALVSRLNARWPGQIVGSTSPELIMADLAVNATPLGLQPRRSSAVSARVAPEDCRGGGHRHAASRDQALTDQRRPWPPDPPRRPHDARAVGSVPRVLRLAVRRGIWRTFVPDDGPRNDADAPLLVLWDIDHTLIENNGVSKEIYAGAFERITGREARGTSLHRGPELTRRSCVICFSGAVLIFTRENFRTASRDSDPPAMKSHTRASSCPRYGPHRAS